jgi:hypothetical protein
MMKPRRDPEALMSDNSPARQFTGIPWFRKDDWEALRELFGDDNDPFPETWEAWYASAIAAEAYLNRHGWRIIRVHIQAAEFRDWCRDLDIAPDANARARWANGIAARKVKQEQ